MNAARAWHRSNLTLLLILPVVLALGALSQTALDDPARSVAQLVLVVVLLLFIVRVVWNARAEKR